MTDIEPDLKQLGDRVVTDIFAMGENVEDPNNYPRLQQYDAWCRRVDEITVAQGWKDLNDVAAEEGLVSIAYERHHGEYSRIYQFAKGYLYSPSAALYSCPLSMTDGAARVMEVYGSKDMKQKYYPRLISRDPKVFWTSGQWMTERPGGSDVSRTETLAELVDAKENKWKISGFKWFSSATTADMTMLLARTIDPDTGLVQQGSRGLSLFVAEMRKPDGQLNGVRVHRLKDKYGTKGLPTAELELNGMEAHMVGQPGRGVATIASILNITRIYSAVGTLCSLRRCLAIAKDFALKRQVGNRTLDKTPLHITTLARLELIFRASAQISFYAVQLLGRTECLPENDPQRQQDMEVLRLLTPIAKAYVCRICVDAISETMEALGGQGYMEEIGIGKNLRNSQVNTIWEGTTNVLALDVLRVLQKSKGAALKTFAEVMDKKIQVALTSSPMVFTDAAQRIRSSLKDIIVFVNEHQRSATVEIHMREVTFALGRVTAATLLMEQAAWALTNSVAGAEQDVAALNQWCQNSQFSKPLVAVGLDTILQEAKMVFGPDAKL
ncbi:acyl-CoA dehydrogenase/oxidase [Halteromyces radiatus]|uniref:acyl-CoA dehydrogenase/oxidase n=1 Tax=Halteromyces radiatus TaxID=101107 RepID=UPI002220185C|nr:acyl-CoA dehydrogenase/oxidase [Halteromyces radiatus]KAI8089846.1 acyl-CoA dehydrogenase/oxidase [Halteromyces radiatus]